MTTNPPPLSSSHLPPESSYISGGNSHSTGNLQGNTVVTDVGVNGSTCPPSDDEDALLLNSGPVFGHRSTTATNETVLAENVSGILTDRSPAPTTTESLGAIPGVASALPTAVLPPPAAVVTAAPPPLPPPPPPPPPPTPPQVVPPDASLPVTAVLPSIAAPSPAAAATVDAEAVAAAAAAAAATTSVEGSNSVDEAAAAFAASFVAAAPAMTSAGSAAAIEAVAAVEGTTTTPAALSTTMEDTVTVAPAHTTMTMTTTTTTPSPSPTTTSVITQEHKDVARKRVADLSLHLLDGIQDESELFWHLRPTKYHKDVQVLPCRRIHEDAAIGLEQCLRKNHNSDQILIKYIGYQHEECANIQWASKTQLVSIYDQKEKHMTTFLQQIRNQQQQYFRNNPIAICMEQFFLERMMEHVANTTRVIHNHKIHSSTSPDTTDHHGEGPKLFSEATAAMSLSQTTATSSEMMDVEPVMVGSPPGSAKAKRKKKVSLLVGDVITYNDPTRVADGNNLKTATIISVNNKQATFPLELDNGDFLPRDHKVKIVAKKTPVKPSKQAGTNPSTTPQEIVTPPMFQPISDYQLRATRQKKTTKTPPKSGITQVATEIKQQITQQQEQILSNIRQNSKNNEETEQLSSLAHDLFMNAKEDTLSPDKTKGKWGGKKKTAGKKRGPKPKAKPPKGKTPTKTPTKKTAASAAKKTQTPKHTLKSATKRKYTKRTTPAKKAKTPASNKKKPITKKHVSFVRKRIVVKPDVSWKPDLIRIIQQTEEKKAQKRTTVHMTLDQLNVALKARTRFEDEIASLEQRRVPLEIKSNHKKTGPISVRAYWTRELAHTCKTSDEGLIKFFEGDEKQYLTQAAILQISSSLQEWVESPPLEITEEDLRLPSCVDQLERIPSDSVPTGVWWQADSDTIIYKVIKDIEEEQREVSTQPEQTTFAAEVATTVTATTHAAAMELDGDNKKLDGESKQVDTTSATPTATGNTDEIVNSTEITATTTPQPASDASAEGKNNSPSATMALSASALDPTSAPTSGEASVPAPTSDSFPAPAALAPTPVEASAPILPPTLATVVLSPQPAGEEAVDDGNKRKFDDIPGEENNKKQKFLGDGSS